MPQLLVFAPCEKVIVSREENNPTLIDLLQQIGAEFQRAESTSPPGGATQTLILPLRWSIFVLWRLAAGETSGKTFTQNVKILAPDGRLLFNHSANFTIEKVAHRMILNMQNIPIPTNSSGTWTLQLFVHETGEAPPVAPIATYPIDVTIVEKAKPQDASTPA